MIAMAEHTVIYAGGGTGGHIYPGLALADYVDLVLRDRGTVRSLFLCSGRAVDERILRAEGVEFRALPASPPGLSPRRLWRFARSWGRSVRMAREAIRAGRAGGGKVCVVSTGGFVAAPVVQAAIVERAPVILLNLDAVPGRANRWLERRVRGRAGCACLAALPVEGPEAARWRVVGPIVRARAKVHDNAVEARTALGLDPARPVLMVCGGSLGAETINRFVAAFADVNPDALRPWQVLHQTGIEENTATLEVYARRGIDALVCGHVVNIGAWWAAADLAVARCGAGLVGEALLHKVPCLFLPYPFHKDGHQAANGRVLERMGGAVVLPDRVSADENLIHHGPVLRDLLRSPMRRAAMSAALGEGRSRFGTVAAAWAVAHTLVPEARWVEGLGWPPPDQP